MKREGNEMPVAVFAMMHPRWFEFFTMQTISDRFKIEL
jgi:hypothetical protein